METLGISIFMSAVVISATQFAVVSIRSKIEAKKIDNDRERSALRHQEEMEHLRLRAFDLESRYLKSSKKDQDDH